MSDSKKYKIAVTGSNGQLGKEFAYIAPKQNDFDYIFLDRQALPFDDPGSVLHWFNTNSINFLINCAAYTAVDLAETEPGKALQINGTIPGLIAEILDKKNIPIIQISTDYVFEGISPTPLSESSETKPVNQYGLSKLEGERLVIQNNRQAQIIRTSWLYSSYGKNFVKTMIRLMKERDHIRVVNDQWGSPTYAADLAEAVHKIIKSGIRGPGIYHYSNEGETNWYEFATEIKTRMASMCEIIPISSEDYKTPARRPAYSLMDTSKIKGTYHLEIPNWKDSLAKCIDRINRLEV